MNTPYYSSSAQESFVFIQSSMFINGLSDIFIPYCTKLI